MRSAIILHGRPDKEEYYDPSFPSASNSHWIPWLQKQLLIREIEAHTPEVPHAYKPNYLLWKKEFERFEVDEETSLVGHSCGAGFLVRWLSEQKDLKVGHVVLVAPWLDPEREDTSDFFNFVIDPEIARRSATFTIFASDNDYKSIKKSVELLLKKIKHCNYREFQGYGHFTRRDMKKEEFPELLSALV